MLLLNFEDLGIEEVDGGAAGEAYAAPGAASAERLPPQRTARRGNPAGPRVAPGVAAGALAAVSVAAHAALTGPYGLTSLLRTATSKRYSPGSASSRSSEERVASLSASMDT